MPVGQQAELAFTADKPDGPTPLEGPEGNGIARQIPRKQPIIVGMGTAGGKGPLAVMVESVGIGNFGDGAYDHLGRQAEPDAGLLIDQVTKRVGTKDAMFPSAVADPVDTTVGRLQGGEQQGRFLGSRQELEFAGQLHEKQCSSFCRPRRIKSKYCWKPTASKAVVSDPVGGT